MERTIIYRTQRTVTDVRTKGGMKAHICVYGEMRERRAKVFGFSSCPTDTYAELG